MVERRVVIPAGILTRWRLLEWLRLRRGSAGRGYSLLGDRQGPSILLELIGLINLLTRVCGVRSRRWFWNGLDVLGERSLPSSELVHNVLNGLLLGIVPSLVGAGRRTELRDRLLFYLRLSGRRTRGASQGVEWGREFEQAFAGRRFRALLLPLGTSRLRNRFGALIYGLVYRGEIIRIYLVPRRLLLRLRRWDERRRGGDGHGRGLRKCCGRFRQVGNRSGAEIREVRNGLETVGRFTKETSERMRQKHTQTSADPAEFCHLGFQRSDSERRSPSAC